MTGLGATPSAGTTKDKMSDFDFSELANMVDAIGLNDAASLKEALPIAFVLDKAGIGVIPEGNTFSFFCAFHDDKNTPAGKIFGEGLAHWNCWACGAPRNGDVLDLIQQLAALDGETLSFVEVCDRARELVLELEASNWEGPRTAAPRKSIDADTVSKIIDRAQANTDISLIDDLVSTKRQRDGEDSNRYSVDFLIDEFGLGVTEMHTKDGQWRDEIVIPYWDASGKLLTYKHRLAESKALAPSGSWPKDLFYNAWRTDALDKPILLCEGESDVWNAQYEVGSAFRVLGVATGVATAPGNMDAFKTKDVLIAFDGDAAGRAGATRWAEALKRIGANVLIVPIPEGKDVSSIAAQLQSLCASARPIVMPPQGLRVTDGGYVRSNSSSDTQVSNFYLEPLRELVGHDNTAFEVRVMPGGATAVIEDRDLMNKGAIVKWALRNKRAWYGTDRDVNVLLGILQAQCIFLPIGRLTSVAGLHDNHFVWPGGQIGPNPWRYTSSGANLEDAIDIRPGSWSPSYIHILRAIHKKSVIDPILAWLFIAPLRSLFHEFPILAISGPHGSGKTQTMETLLRAVTGTYIAKTLTGTTPFAVITSFSSTNGFPVIFEEYRNGARDDAKQIFEQLARDAYTMQPSEKGGMKSSWADITSIVPTAPVIVSGEDMFSEGSHIERMILLQMERSGQNTKAFKEANSWLHNGLPYAILTWWHRSLMDGTIADLKVTPYTKAGDLGPRQRTNIGILQLSWKYLQMFMNDAEDSLADPDFSMVISELREANIHTPIEDALRWCLEEADASSFVRLQDDHVLVRIENFVSFINERKRRGDLSFTLPGRAPSVKKYIQSKFDAQQVTIRLGGLSQVWLQFPYEKLA